MPISVSTARAIKENGLTTWKNDVEYALAPPRFRFSRFVRTELDWNFQAIRRACASSRATSAGLFEFHSWSTSARARTSSASLSIKMRVASITRYPVTELVVLRDCFRGNGFDALAHLPPLKNH